MRTSELPRPHDATFDAAFLKRLVFAIGATPAVILAFDAARHALGVNAVNYAIRTTGMLTLVFLVLTLFVTPLRRITGVAMTIAVRRTLGLFAFFYLFVHVSLFYGLDRAASLSSTIHEMLARRYLQIGTVAFLLMIPLALTSTNGMVLRLGAKRWKKLHRLTYLIAALGCIHYVMLVKADVRQPLFFGGVVALLLAYRAVVAIRERRSHVPVPRAQRWKGKLKIISTKKETADVRTLRLADPSGAPLPFAFVPGQYLLVSFEIDGKTVRRSYTIASSAAQKGWCEITVKRTDGGYVSHHVHDALAEGDLIALEAPAGSFVFDPAKETCETVVLIGGGVGITPLMSILRSLADQGWKRQIVMLLTMRTEEDIVFRDELEDLAKRLPNLRLTITLTRETRDGRLQGKLTAEALGKILAKKSSAPIYLCGPDAMMRDVSAALRSLGIAGDAIKTELFVSPDSAPPPEGDDREHEVAFERTDVVVSASRRLTLLEAAESAGLELPYECRSGICGQCKVKLLRGEVTMAVEEGLSQAEKLDDVVLACQARAKTDVAIDA